MVLSVANTLTVSWTTISFTGLIVMLIMFSRTVGDFRYLIKYNQNGPRLYTAKTSIYIFAGGVITQLSYVIGACMVLVRNKPPVSKAGWVFIVASIFSLLMAFVIHQRKLRLIGMLEQYEEEEV